MAKLEIIKGYIVAIGPINKKKFIFIFAIKKPSTRKYFFFIK